ncbi:RNA binding protein fox-1 3 [Sarcoptes scabiei]|uniref:Signal recognition particle 9 kDa protein n=1 Tax=Sarcoptes scabiei TaxID=52283 RepID=A0A132AKU1_SARSC|nr:signal recognition particle 9 kDa protein-like protein [Sarcoptes scabiei]UXI23161.1 RNA binding protein fox-1 3 [Sarcoptes scabiei]
MPYLDNWNEFAQAAEALYLENPLRCRLVMKYRHTQGSLIVKCTDNKVCLLYRTENAQDIKRIEKLNSQLMRHMASDED